MYFFKTICKLGFISFIIAATIYNANIDVTKVTLILLHMKLSTCAMIIAAFALNFYLGSMRNYLGYQQFKLPVSFSALQLGLLSGVLGGIVPIFGSAVTQSLSLKKSSGLPASTSVLLFFYDKIIMAIAGLSMTCVAVFMLVHDWDFLKQIAIQNEGSSLFEFMTCLAMCVSVVFMYVVPKTNRLTVFKLINLRTISYITGSLLLSFGMWFISTSCFVQCIQDFYGADFNTLARSEVFAACSIISFMASLPISVNGWGVREFAAISVLAFLAIPAEVALSAAITVGVLSTGSVLILFVAHTAIVHRFSGDSLATTQK